MRFLKKLFDFYLNGSIHVALAVVAFVKMTQFIFRISGDNAPLYFAFFGTIVGYNFVKYDALARIKKIQLKSKLKAIIVLSIVSFLFAGFFFLQLATTTKIVGILFLVLTLLYALPFFPNRENARNWAGIKIYIVALCWVGVTLFLPVVNANVPIDQVVLQVALQRFILVFVLILIFEIIDLRTDDPHLKTVPQQIGVNRTKIAGSLLLLVFLVLEFFDPNFKYPTLLLKTGIAFTTFFFLLFANESRSKYYSSFWVESIPVFWWVLLVVLQ